MKLRESLRTRLIYPYLKHVYERKYLSERAESLDLLEGKRKIVKPICEKEAGGLVVHILLDNTLYITDILHMLQLESGVLRGRYAFRGSVIP
jgi:hypothetical protein